MTAANAPNVSSLLKWDVRLVDKDPIDDGDLGEGRVVLRRPMQQGNHEVRGYHPPTMAPLWPPQDHNQPYTKMKSSPTSTLEQLLAGWNVGATG